MKKWLTVYIWLVPFLVSNGSEAIIECLGYPSMGEIPPRLQIAVNDNFGESNTEVGSIVEGPYYTCQVQGTAMGRYLSLSLIVVYTPKNNVNDKRLTQFDLYCENGGRGLESNAWSTVQHSLSTPTVADYANIPLFTNCSSCTIAANNDNRCQACHSDCNVGLMRCSGTASSQCCVAFEDDGACSPDLNCEENNFAANEQNDFTCACELVCTPGNVLDNSTCTCVLTDICLADNPCVNGDCMLVTSPNQYTCDCTTNYIGMNCSVCSLSCQAGFIPDSNCFECILNDACEAFTPCENGGTCTLGTAPDQFSCNCTNSYDSSTNCSVCALSCQTGFVPDVNCFECILNDACEAFTPCENGGTCTLVTAPDQFSCNCTNSYDSNTNCSVCALSCQAGYVPDSNCFECILNDACEAFSPCENGGTCTLGTAPDQFSCDCTNSYDSNTNCSVCALSCQTGFVPDGNCFECILNDACEAFTPCENGGTCTLVTAPDQFSCNCTNSYDSNTNCSVCALSCQTGFVPDGNCFECILNDACEAFTPCENGGTCTLGTAPDQFSCNCTNSYDSNTNCSVCALSCQAGYVPDSNCFECILNDACEAFTPCENGGTCTLGTAPDQFSCDCTNSYDSNTNCSVCALSCQTGFVPDGNCFECILNDACEAFTPCENGGTCTLGTAPDQFSCDCTNSYDSNTNCSVCALSCQAGFVPDGNCFECILNDACEAFSPCENGGTCTLGTAPDQFNCDCTNSYDSNTNCSVCALGCQAGFVPDSNCFECILNDACEAFSPCENGGTCTLGTAPDQFSCDCTNSYDSNTNCSVCALSCQAGFVPDSNCFECILNDACEAFTPCENGGTCTLDTAPDQFSCNCTNSYDSNTNCSVCALICQAGFVPDGNCFECILNDACEAFTPCENGGTCTLDTAPDQFTCNCTNSYDSNTNCSVCALSCQTGFVPDGNCFECILNDACEAFTPCENGGTCTLVTAPDQFSCNCTNSYDSNTNCSVCALSCQAGYVPDGNCFECILNDACEAFTPCENGGTCTLGTAPDQFNCDCTNSYDSNTNCSVCALSCQAGFVPDGNCFECILNDACEAFTPCENGGTCTLGTAPDQFSCNCTNSYDSNTNCSVCALSCQTGFVPDGNCFECILNDACEAFTPCENGGTCTLDTAPDQFSCNCTNSYDSNTNCSVCALSCQAGYVPDSNCFECILNDACEAFSPCENGGTCTLGTAPDQFSCDCTNSYDSNTNCSVCALSCQTGFVPDGNCFECILNDACEAFTPCENGGTCTLGTAPDQFSCDCTNSYDSNTNCSVCALSCQAGFVPDGNCFECILNDACEAFTPCENGGTCTLGTAPDQFSCNCTNSYDSNTNCSVCALSCQTGFVPDGICFECILNDACEAFTPCENGGTCTLVTAPDQFSCNCTNSYDSNTNCSVCALSCQAGYVPDSNCFECILNDACEAFSPCENGGTCTLGTAPDQFSCDCTNSYDSNTNCSVCALSCQTGFVPDGNCFECILNDACEAFTPCENGGTCTLGTAPDQFNCDCTNSYDSNTNCSVCALSCQAGFVPDGNCFECILNDACEAFTPCENGGTCTLGTAPDQFSCNCTNSYDSNTNCSVCALSCQTGFVPDGNCFECILNDACEAFTPCENGGTCTLDTAPDQFSCNCTNSYDSNTNCSVCALSCQAGYVPDGNCFECILNDACEAFTPCENGGTCTLGTAPDQFSCDCTNSYDSNTNCSVCALSCQAGFVPDGNCFECILNDACEAFTPCENGGTCTLDTAPDQFTCNCTNSYDSNTNCSVCALSCQAGFVPDGNCFECILNDACEAFTPCENGGTCTLVTAPDQFSCNCTNSYDSNTNCSVCALSCQAGFVPDSNCFECILNDACEAFTPCENGGTCTLDTAPDQFSCNCTNSYDSNTNCSVCALSCQAGFVPDGNCFECILNDACEAFTPCENGGTCTLDTAPDQFSCNCTNSYDSSTNCSVCALSCQAGFIPDSNCFECTLNDACEAFTPCENGGTCTLVTAPDQFSCNCTNSYDSNTNCSVCALSCQAGFIPDSNCFECTLNDACEAFTPCENGGTCTLVTAPDQFSCNCTNSYDSNTNCSVCALSCQAGYVPDSNCFECILNDACEAFTPCENGGTCTLDTAPDQFSCNCTNSYDSNTNCSVCALSCQAGFIPDSNCYQCILSDICVASNPCKNNGQCMLVSAPSQYTCICNTTSFTGENCSECNVTCERGFSLVSETCQCELGDICDAESPCVNGGTCLRGLLPVDYRCQCINNYRGTNCTVCTLSCNEGVVDSNCKSCDCHTGYFGDTCELIDYCSRGNYCSGRGVCSNLQNRFECTCQTGYTGSDCSTCDDRYNAVDNNCEFFTGSENNSVVWWHILVALLIIVVIISAIILIVILIVLYRRKRTGQMSAI